MVHIVSCFQLSSSPLKLDKRAQPQLKNQNTGVHNPLPSKYSIQPVTGLSYQTKATTSRAVNKMARQNAPRTSSTSPNKNKGSESGPRQTSLKNICEVTNILKYLDCPAIVVGQVAVSYMGREHGKHHTVDFLVQSSKLKALKKQLTDSTQWKVAKDINREAEDVIEQHKSWRMALSTKGLDIPRRQCTIRMVQRDADVLLQNTRHKPGEYLFLRLWTEESYHMSIKEGYFYEVDHLADAVKTRSRDLWSEETIDMINKAKLSSSSPRRSPQSTSSKVLIPTYKTILDSLVYHRINNTKDKSFLSRDAESLIHELVERHCLEHSPTREMIIDQAGDGKTKQWLQDYIDDYYRPEQRGREEDDLQVTRNSMTTKYAEEAYERRMLKRTRLAKLVSPRSSGSGNSSDSSNQKRKRRPDEEESPSPKKRKPSPEAEDSQGEDDSDDAPQGYHWEVQMSKKEKRRAELDEAKKRRREKAERREKRLNAPVPKCKQNAELSPSPERPPIIREVRIPHKPNKLFRERFSGKPKPKPKPQPSNQA